MQALRYIKIDDLLQDVLDVAVWYVSLKEKSKEIPEEIRILIRLVERALNIDLEEIGRRAIEKIKRVSL